MLCKRRFAMNELMRVSRASDGSIRFGGRGGRGVWLCSQSDEGKRSTAIRSGLRGSVTDDEVDMIEKAHREWVDAQSKRRGA